MLNQAHDIVCSGEQNFVFAQNPVTNLVHVTRSQVDAEWTELERTVVQVARPSIESRFDWSIDQDIVDQSKSEVTQAIFMVDTSAHLNNISHVDFSLEQFLAVHELSKWSTAEAAKAQSCTDLNAGIVALRALRHLMQNTSINNCQDVPWQQCAELNMTQLRALCPRRCNCDRPPLISPGYAGIFRTPASGCPAQCATLTASYNEISYQKASPYQAVDALSVHSCTDVQPEKFIHDAIQTCVNSDQFEIGVTGPAVNRDGQSCEYYYRDTHTYTEYVFNNTANESMYVTTTLENVLFYSFRGSNYEWPEFEEYCPHIYDDEDFTANDMCCACKGGGLQNRTFSSVSCSQDLEHDCHTMSPPAFWFLLYIKGLFESLNANQFFIHTLRDAVYNPAQLIGTEFYGNEELIQSVVNGSLVESLLNGKWEFMPNRSHPRGLTGCDFLTSLEFKSLLNIDLCDSSEYSSIKFLCPESCGCRPSVFSNPHGDVYFNQNFQDVTATQILDERQQIAPQTFIFSNDRVGLSECPASCTIPHRDLPGQNKGWDLFEEVEYDPSNYYWWYSDEPSSHPTPAPGEDGSSTTTVL
jgi:hypothetical protein